MWGREERHGGGRRGSGEVCVFGGVGEAFPSLSTPRPIHKAH